MRKSIILMLTYINLTLLLSFPATSLIAQTDFWQQTNGPLGGSVNSFAINSNGDIFAGTSGGGVFRSNDNGDNWTPTSLTNISVRALAINASGDLFATTGGRERIFRSTDNGDNWTPTGIGFVSSVLALAINASGDIFAGTSGGIYRSSDNGDNWSPINTGLTSTFVQAFAINANGDIFAGTSGGVFRSTDNGDNWSPINTGLTTTRVNALAINANGDIFAGTSGGGIFRSTDNGDNWTPTSLTNISVRVLSINASGDLFAGTSGGIYRSTDNGDNWSPVNTGLTNTFVQAFAINANGDIFAGTSGGGIFRSSDNGDNWSVINNGLTTTSVEVLAINGNGDIFAATVVPGSSAGGTVFRSTDNGDNWTPTGLTRTIATLAINASGDIFAGATGSHEMFRSTDNGDNWTRIDNGLGNAGVQALAISASGDIFAGTVFTDGVFRSADNGNSWTQTGLSNRVSALAVNASGDIFAGSDGVVFRSSDRGDNWTQIDLGLTGFNPVQAFAFNSNGDIFTGTLNSGVLRSTDNGDNWTQTGLTRTPVLALAINSNGDIFAGTINGGVFRSTNNGDNWSPINTGLTSTTVYALAINRNNGIFAGTFGGGVFRSDLIPDIELSHDTLNYGSAFIGASVTRTLTVTNRGTDVLTVSEISSDNSSYTVDITSFSLNPGESREVLVTFTPNTTGDFSGILTITSDDPDEPTVTVALTGEGLVPPNISVSPDSLSEDLLTGETSTQILTISNTGESNLTFDISIEQVAAVTVASVSLKVNTPGLDKTGRELDTKSWSRSAEAAAGGHFDITPYNLNSRIMPTSSAMTNAPKVLLLSNNGPEFDFTGFAKTALISTGLFTDPDIDILNDPFSISLTDLMPYDAVLMWTNNNLTDPQNIGDVLKQYVDAGGGVVIATYAYSTNWAIQGAILGGNYPPFIPGSEQTVSGEIDLNNLPFPQHPIFNNINNTPTYWNNANYSNPSLNTGGILLAMDTIGNNVVAENPSGKVVGIVAFPGILGNPDTNNETRLMFANALYYVSVLKIDWLTVNLASGSVPSGSSLDIEVTFDATGLNGGDYDANIIISSNDPDESEVVVPAHLQVTGAPDIAVSNDTLDYGSVFLGAAPTRTLIISNVGTDLLTVSDISSDNSSYTVDITSFSLNPGESREVLVTFTPNTTGDFSGILTITSDDPDESTVTVALQGAGLLPPDISVSPVSLSEDLFTGETATQLLTISNTGVSDLSFEISIEEVITATNASMSVKVHTTLLDETGRKSDTTSWDKRRRYTFAELRNLWKRKGNLSSSDIKNVTHSKLAVGSAIRTVAPNWQLLYADPDEPELTYDIESVFGDVTRNELLIKLESYVAWSDPAGNGIAFIFIDADQDAATGLNSEADDELGWNLGIEFAILRTGDQTYDGLYQWNDNFAAFEKIEDLITDIVEANSNLTIVGVNRSYFETFSAVNLAMTAGSFNDPDLDFVPDIGTGHITFPLTPPWIRLSVTEGVIPAGSQEEITVTFDATGLNGGDYDANIIISSDDPDESEVVVPAHLQVTGAPDIAVSNDTLDYGSVFLGASPTHTLIISNVGTDLLTVSDISSDNSTYTVDITSFNLNPGESQEVLVTFTPNTTGDFSGILTITSDDPDESTVTVALQGEGLLPPDISVSPDALSEDLFTGETATQMLTISNTGVSDLSFEISIEEIGTPGVSLIGVNTNKSSGEYPEVPLVEIRKGEKDPRVYPSTFSGGGGPDAFGYRWEDSNEPGGPIFNWIDVSGGTSIFLGDDDFVTGIPLGFTFPYYGIDFSEIGVGSNGWLSFNGFNGWFPSNVPAIDEFEGAIAPFASDLFPPNATYIHYQTFGVAPNRYFVVEYNSIPDCCEFENPKTFEVIFYEGSNTLRFQYLTVPDDPVAIGIESPDQTIGMGNAGIDSLFISPALIEDNYAIEFTLQPGWLTVNPSSGTVPPGSSLDIEVTFDATGLIGGDYDANIVISSNDPDESEVIVPAHLHVEAPPTPVEEVTSEVPISFSLHQNYPNPFNPTTTIQFALPKKSEVKLKLFDVLGRRVATLVDEELEAGEYRVNFEAEGLPSGVYFYRLTAGRFVETRKLTLLK